jgi:transcriptional regulator with XRE-family HTH domain
MDLREYRKVKYITVRKASEELGISRQHIYDIEKRKSFPSRKLSIRIYEWSNGLVNHVDLLFPDLSKSLNDNIVKLDNWEEKERQNKKRTLHDAEIMRNI